MQPSRRSHLLRLPLLGALLAVGMLALAGPAAAHGDRERAERLRAAYAGTDGGATGTGVPLVTSGNVRLVGSHPGSAGISGCFLRTAPVFVTSNLDSLKVYDVRDPLHPRLTGVLPSVQFENEAMSCGERRTPHGVRRFVLIGVDLYQASADDLQHADVRPGLGSYRMVVVDVTDPAHPFVRSRADATTSTHTVTCVGGPDCRYVYSAGSGDAFSILDLRSLSHPREVDSRPGRAGVQPFRSPTAGHKWNFDSAGYGTHTGFGGTSVFDVRKPRHPRLVTTTGRAGRGTDPRYPGWNDFIHHNSFRPNARAFRPGASPSFAHGNVLLVTEEDYEQTDCSKAGSFQTWWVKRLDGSKGAVVPLDKVELSDLGSFPVPHDAFCSAHWFSYHPSGVVAVGFYGGGMQLVDVRRPGRLKPYGHASWGASEVWDAMWVPRYDVLGRDTGRKTNLVYAVDLVRGLDVYTVDLPGRDAARDTVPLAGAGPFPSLRGPGDALPLVVLGLGAGAALVLRRRAGTVSARALPHGLAVAAGTPPRS